MTLENRFGLVVLQNLPWQHLVQLWKTFDHLGFDNTWVADHFVNYASPQDPWYEGWTTLTGLASATSNIRLGTLVTSIPFRNPAVLARQAMTLDHISNGRLEIGIGAGAPGNIDPSYRMTGSEDWPPAERVKRLREQVEILDTLLRNPQASYKGEYYHLEEVAMAPGPVQKPRPPLTIAGHGKKTLKVVAEFADTWNSFGADFGSPPEVVVEKTRERNAYLDRQCERLGRDPGSLRRSLLVFGSEANQVFASEEKFLETFERYSAIGINELIFFYPFFAPEQVPMVEMIARETIPTLRM